MNNIRAILAGTMVWFFIFSTFIVLEFVPLIQDSLNLQALIVSILIVPYAIAGASVFYKNANKANGIRVGIIMALTALMLDALITVPFVEIPNGGSFQSFYSFPLLWLMVMINITTVSLYWNLRVKR